jgi:hypothetical protein
MFLALFYFSRSTSVFAVALLSTANITLASLIILRLVRHQRHVRKVLGAEHGSPYFTVITMCIESSALIVIFSAVYIVIVLMRPIQTGSVFAPLLLLPHICVGGLGSYDFLCTSRIFFVRNIIQVISPLLIVYRVAKGRTTTTTLPPSEQEMAQIRFNNPPSSQEGDVTV